MFSGGREWKGALGTNGLILVEYRCKIEVLKSLRNNNINAGINNNGNYWLIFHTSVLTQAFVIRDLGEHHDQLQDFKMKKGRKPIFPRVFLVTALAENPAGNYMFNVNYWNTRTRCEIYLCWKLTIKTNGVVPVSFLLTLNIFHTLF